VVAKPIGGSVRYLPVYALACPMPPWRDCEHEGVTMKRIRMGGPNGAIRPYSTLPPTDEPAEQIAQALDHIAVSLSAIDHNLDQLTTIMAELAKKMR
jgi:hypothetical protein